MRLTKKISAIVLALALLVSCMSVFTVSAATNTVINLTAPRNGQTGYAMYDYTQAVYADASWRMFFYADVASPDLNVAFGDYTVTWDNGGNTGASAVQIYPQNENAVMWAVIWGLPAADALVDGATMKIAAGTGTASTGNSLTLETDVNMKWHADTQSWEYIVETPNHTANKLVLGSPTNSASGIYANSVDSAPYDGNWNYRYYPVASQGEVTLIRNGVETKMDGYLQKIQSSTYYINIATTAQVGDTIRVSGVFALQDQNYDWRAGWYPGTYVEFPETAFDFDGSNWSAGYVKDENTVVLSHLDVISEHQSATAFYTAFPVGTTGLTVDNDWFTRFYPMTNQDGGYVNGTDYANRFLLDNGGGMPIQSSAGAAGLYVTGFGTATAGTTVTIKGDFYGYNRNTGVMNGESFSLYAPVTFTYDGSKWTRTSEIPDIPQPEITYDHNYAGSFTATGAQIVTTDPTSLYLKGSESLADAFVGDYSDGTWNMAFLSPAFGDDNGVFLNDTQIVGVSFQQYSQSNRYYFLNGFGTANTGDILTIKGDFINADYSVKITVAESKFQWDGSKWVDYIERNYSDFTVSGLSDLQTSANYRHFYLNIDGQVPGDWDKFVGLQMSVNDGAKFDISVGNTGNKSVVVFDLPYSEMPADIAVGTTLTLYAGTATPRNDAVNVALNDAIRLTEDCTLVWDGTTWVLEEAYNPTTYYDFTISGLNVVQDNLANEYRHFYLNISGSVPGDWDKFEGLKFAVNDGAQFDARVGNNGSTSVICFDMHTSQLPADIAVGTKLTVYAGEATAVADAPNVNATDVIRLTADYTMIWNGTAWVSAPDYVVYNDLTLTGTVSPTGWNGSIWNFYISVNGTIPGVGDSGYYFTPAYVTVVDGSGNTLLNKLEKNLAFAAHHSTLFFNLDADTLPQASVTEGSVLTVHSGKMDPLSWESIARNEDGYQIGINVQNDLVLVWDGTSWINYLDRSEYTVYEGSVSIKGAEVETSTPPHLYLQGSDTLDPVMKEVATEWNQAYVYPMLGSDNGVFLNGNKISVNFQKYNGAGNRWFMESITPSAAGDTLVIKGQFYNDIHKVLVNLAPLTLVWDGSKWVQQITTDVEKDVNGDGAVDIRDAVVLQMHLVDVSVAVSNKADINESGSVTSDDQRVLRRYLLGIVLTYVNDIPLGTPYYAGGEMIKVAYIPPAIATYNWDTDTVTFKSDAEIDRLMDEYAAAGFTHINPESFGYYFDQAPEWEPQTVLYRYFEEAEERGLKVIVSSQYINRLLQTSQDIDTYDPSDSTQINVTNWRAVVDHIVAILSEYPSFWGFMMADEPSTDEVANYLKVVPYINEKHPSVGTYWANFPSYVQSSALGSYTYDQYVTALGTGTGYFMYDSYCLVNQDTWYGSSNNYIDQYWFSNLNKVATLGRDNNFATGITMQATALTPTGGDGLFSNTYQRRQITSDADIGFQVYTSLAYGFKELSYFTYADHPSGADAGVVLNTSMVGTNLTTKNAAYYAVQNTHAEIKDLEAALVNFNWLGTIELNLEDSDDKTSTYTAANNSRLASVANASGALVIGCMKDGDGYDGYMVANASEPSKTSTSSVKLTFNNATKALVYINGVAQEVALTNGAYTVSVADGEGVFIVPIYEG